MVFITCQLAVQDKSTSSYRYLKLKCTVNQYTSNHTLFLNEKRNIRMGYSFSKNYSAHTNEYIHDEDDEERVAEA